MSISPGSNNLQSMDHSNSNNNNNQVVEREEKEKITTTPTATSDESLLTLTKTSGGEHEWCHKSTIIVVAAKPTSSNNNPTATKQSSDMDKVEESDEPLLKQLSNQASNLISILQQQCLQNIADWRRSLPNRSFVLLKKYKELILKSSSDDAFAIETLNDEPVLFHIQLESFFVSVARLKNPGLVNKPVVITQSIEAETKSSVSFASAEAVGKGIQIGMWVTQAKKLCPELVSIPCEFEDCSMVSKLFIETVASLTLEMEAISCDEILVDVTALVKSSVGENPRVDAMGLAKFLLAEIKNTTAITAYIGIGANRLIAQIATKVAKDNNNGTGCHYLTQDEAKEYIMRSPVSELPGVDTETVETLKSLYNVNTGAELEVLELGELINVFGGKMGNKLYSACDGSDTHTLDTAPFCAKSISAGRAYGLRLTNSVEFENYVKQIAQEAANKASITNCYCKQMNLYLFIARTLADDKKAVKFDVDHGFGDARLGTVEFKEKTRDAGLISGSALNVARERMTTWANESPQRIRGAVVSLDELIYE